MKKKNIAEGCLRNIIAKIVLISQLLRKRRLKSQKLTNRFLRTDNRVMAIAHTVLWFR